MHKHLQNLERLFQKMQARYGDNDELVLQLKQELIAFEAKATKNRANFNKRRRKVDLSPPSYVVH